jgi:DNA-binding transcriptional LysR family regulator
MAEGRHGCFVRARLEISVTVGGRLKVTAAEGLREAVFAHLGLAITSEWNFAPELAAGIVRPVLLDWDLPTLELWAVFTTGRMASAGTREFVSFVESCIPAANYGPLKEPASV